MLTSRQARQKERHLLQNPAILRHFLWAQGQVAIGANTLPRITAAAEDIAGHKYITYDFTEAARKPETEGGSDTSSWSFSVHARYRPIDILGEGAYGKVLLAEDLLQPVREYSHPVSQKLPVPLPDEGPVLAATPPLGVPHTPVCARIRYRRVAIKRIQLHDYHPIFSVRTLRELRLLRLVTKNNWQEPFRAAHQCTPLCDCSNATFPAKGDDDEDEEGNGTNLVGFVELMRPPLNAFKRATQKPYVLLDSQGGGMSPVKHVYVVTEAMQTTLKYVCDSTQNITEDHARWFMYCLLVALRYLHSGGIVHRDIKARNILVNANCDLRLCDLGLARTLPPQHRDAMQFRRAHIPPHTQCSREGLPLDSKSYLTTCVVTRWYRPPELLLGDAKEYGPKLDIWSAGCVMAELLWRRRLWKDEVYTASMTLSKRPRNDSENNANLSNTERRSKAEPNSAERNSTTAKSGSDDDENEGDLLVRAALFQGESSHEQLYQICRLRGLPSQEQFRRIPNTAVEALQPVKDARERSLRLLFPLASKQAVEVVEGLLCLDPDKRWSAEQALQHEFFRPLRLPEEEPIMSEFQCQQLRHEFAFEAIADQVTAPELTLQILGELWASHPCATEIGEYLRHARSVRKMCRLPVQMPRQQSAPPPQMLRHRCVDDTLEEENM